jgi:hypothetical protein
MSAERFELHNFDVLLNGIEIRSHVYHYFFNPPKPEDKAELEQIGAAAADKDFKVPLGGLNLLEEFRAAVGETLVHPERGKHFFAPHGAKAHVV